jgi:hypothetical protein
VFRIQTGLVQDTNRPCSGAKQVRAVLTNISRICLNYSRFFLNFAELKIEKLRYYLTSKKL